MPFGGLKFIMTFVHASCDDSKRKQLWDELCNLNFNCPWMLSEEFNVVSTWRMASKPIT